MKHMLILSCIIGLISGCGVALGMNTDNVLTEFTQGWKIVLMSTLKPCDSNPLPIVLANFGKEPSRNKDHTLVWLELCSPDHLSKNGTTIAHDKITKCVFSSSLPLMPPYFPQGVVYLTVEEDQVKQTPKKRILEIDHSKNLTIAIDIGPAPVREINLNPQAHQDGRASDSVDEEDKPIFTPIKHAFKTTKYSSDIFGTNASDTPKRNFIVPGLVFGSLVIGTTFFIMLLKMGYRLPDNIMNILRDPIGRILK